VEVGLLRSGGGQRPPNAVLSDATGVHAERPLYFFLERYADSFTAELTAFVAAVQHDTPPPVSGAAGRAAVVIALAAQKSLAEHRPVAVAEIG
jgi:myo-inositol 2-dehydrogenase/D-chiro-inositol 1-dehydrogenase